MQLLLNSSTTCGKKHPKCCTLYYNTTSFWTPFHFLISARCTCISLMCTHPGLPLITLHGLPSFCGSILCSIIHTTQDGTSTTFLAHVRTKAHFGIARDTPEGLLWCANEWFCAFCARVANARPQPASIRTGDHVPLAHNSGNPDKRSGGPFNVEDSGRSCGGSAVCWNEECTIQWWTRRWVTGTCHHKKRTIATLSGRDAGVTQPATPFEPLRCSSHKRTRADGTSF